MKLQVVFHRGEDGFIIAECPVLPGCVSQGKTKQQATENIIAAIEGCIEVRREMGWSDVDEMIDVEVTL